MDYWKSKVVPKIKQVFDKNGIKKTAAAEASKSFDESKEGYSKEFEEKKTELQPKVLELYEASPAPIKALVKEPKEAGLKKNSAAVQKFLDELAKLDFPGAKVISEASSKCGPALVSGPISSIFEKISTFIGTEEKSAGEAAAPEETKPTGGETTTTKDKEIAIEEEKKEAPATATATAESTTPTTEETKPATEPAVAAPATVEPAPKA